MTSVDQSDLVRELALAAVREASGAEWTSIVYRVAALVSITDDSLVINNGPESSTRMFATMEMAEIADRLRAAMYRPGVGTWFSAVLVVTSEGEVDVDFNYDDEPTWNTPVGSTAYRQDLERFPRSPHATPTWLAEHRTSPGGT